MDRSILHADLNNCFASIEILLNPKWKGIPLAVGGSVEDRHGIILAKSEEAKKFGISTGEPLWSAYKKCKDLLVVPPHYNTYLKYSKMVQELYYEYTNLVEPFGLDECWLDVSGSHALFGSGLEIANSLRQRIKKEIGLTLSIGVSFNKVFSKFASDLKKPDAISCINRENFKTIVWPAPIEKFLGVGRKTQKKLNSKNIFTLKELAKTDPKFLKNWLGVQGQKLWEQVNGIDPSPVEDYMFQRQIKSVGRGITCAKDLLNLEDVHGVFHFLATRVSETLKNKKLKAKGISIEIKKPDLSSSGYQMALPYLTNSETVLTRMALALMEKQHPFTAPIRALSIRAFDLQPSGQPIQTSFFDDSSAESLDEICYLIRKKYGKESITYGHLLNDLPLPKNTGSTFKAH